MKKFNLLRASSLILSSYFIIGFSSCSYSIKNSNNSHYVEININDLILEKLKIEEYLKNSCELKEVFNKFEKDYESKNVYIFNIPRTYQEYQFYVYDGKDYINIGYISKNGNELVLEYLINDNHLVIYSTPEHMYNGIDLNDIENDPVTITYKRMNKDGDIVT